MTAIIHSSTYSYIFVHQPQEAFLLDYEAGANEGTGADGQQHSNEEVPAVIDCWLCEAGQWDH